MGRVAKQPRGCNQWAPRRLWVPSLAPCLLIRSEEKGHQLLAKALETDGWVNLDVSKDTPHHPGTCPDNSPKPLPKPTQHLSLMLPQEL